VQEIVAEHEQAFLHETLAFLAARARLAPERDLA
jgi:hypothetical protein